MKYRFERIRYNTIEEFEIDVPDETKFLKYDCVSESQQMWMFLIPFDKNIFEKLNDIIACNCKRFGNNKFMEKSTILCHMHNVKPLQELPETDFEEFNKRFHEYYDDIYVETYKIDRKELDKKISEFFDIKGIISIANAVEEIKKTVTMYHFKEFVKGSGGHSEPMVNASSVTFEKLIYDEEACFINDGNVSFDGLFDNLIWNDNFNSDMAISGIDGTYMKKKCKFKNRVNEIVDNL